MDIQKVILSAGRDELGEIYRMRSGCGSKRRARCAYPNRPALTGPKTSSAIHQFLQHGGEARLHAFAFVSRQLHAAGQIAAHG